MLLMKRKDVNQGDGVNVYYPSWVVQNTTEEVKSIMQGLENLGKHQTRALKSTHDVQ